MNNIRIEGRRWRDKINGNTYHSARVYVDGALVAAAPFQYGYGDQYVWTGWEAAVKALKLEPERFSNGSSESPYRWCERNKVEYSADYVDVNKRDVIAWGHIEPSTEEKMLQAQQHAVKLVEKALEK